MFFGPCQRQKFVFHHISIIAPTPFKLNGRSLNLKINLRHHHVICLTVKSIWCNIITLSTSSIECSNLRLCIHIGFQDHFITISHYLTFISMSTISHYLTFISMSNFHCRIRIQKICKIVKIKLS